MNPENTGKHIDLHHSALWRKPMFTTHDPHEIPYPKQQLNERTPPLIQLHRAVSAGEIVTIAYMHDPLFMTHALAYPNPLLVRSKSTAS